MLTKWDKFRIYRKWVWFGVKERAIDLGLIAVPVFTMTGMIAAFARFWQWVFWA